MRDGNRLKEKVELRLDQRQVVSFAVVALLLAGAVFALGVMVGSKLAGAPAQPNARPEALLDRLDDSARLGGADAGARSSPSSDGLTFQEELTRKNPPGPLPKPAPVHPPVAKATPAPKPLAPQPPAAPAEEGRSSAPLPAIPKVAPPAAAPYFTLQIKATQSQPEAARFSARLTSEGFHPFVAEAELPGKGRWYRVRVGHFDSRAKADRYLMDFKRETHLEAFVTAAGH